MTTDKVPDDADAILINTPTVDYSEEEAQKIIDYLEDGGKAIIFSNYTVEDMPNFDSVSYTHLIMSVITYFISMIPGMSVWQKSLQGGIIIVAVAINYFTEQSAKRQALKERSALI